MRITKAIIEARIAAVERRYQDATGKKIDRNDGYAQCSRFSMKRPNDWTCSVAENAHRLYGEYSALKELLQ